MRGVVGKVDVRGCVEVWGEGGVTGWGGGWGEWVG